LFWATREVEAKLRVTLDDERNKCQYQCQCKTKARQISSKSYNEISTDTNIKKGSVLKNNEIMLVAENENSQTQEPDTGESQTQVPDTGESQTQESVVKPANSVFNWYKHAKK